MASPNPSIQIVCPVRNGGANFCGTLLSFSRLKETENAFLLVSDNYSDDGMPWKSTLDSLNNLPVEVIRPPKPLGRIEHWNWIFSQAKADLIKPVMVGEELLPNYLQEIRKVFRENHDLSLVFCQIKPLEKNGPKQPVPEIDNKLIDYDEYLRLCIKQMKMNVIGPLSAVIFDRRYLEHALPFSQKHSWTADWRLYSSCIRQAPAFFVRQPLCLFNQKIPRFSTRFSNVWNAISEEWEYLAELSAQLPDESELSKFILRTKLVGWQAIMKIGKAILPQKIRHPLGKLLQFLQRRSSVN